MTEYNYIENYEFDKEIVGSFTSEELQGGYQPYSGEPEADEEWLLEFYADKQKENERNEELGRWQGLESAISCIPNIRIDDKVLNDSDTIAQQKLKEKVEEYELQIEDFKSQLERANKELEHLRLDNQRLKDENSALLRVVNQLSTKKK